MPNLPFQLISITADIVIFAWVGYYLLKLHSKEKEIEKKEKNIDTSYHKVVDDALSKERKILDDATQEAGQIISGAQYLTTSSKDVLNQAQEKIIADTKTQSQAISQEVMNNYVAYLKQIANTSLADFAAIMKNLQVDMQNQVKDFHNTMLPGLQKELDEYKATRMKQTEQTITKVVQKASQEVLNKTLSLDDHQALILESMEKAKKEGVFE